MNEHGSSDGIGVGNKGLPDHLRHVRGWNVFDEEAALPTAVVVRPVLEHNSATMAAYCEAHGVSLAPHGKTTMSPELFALQLRDGAWAITAANVHQAQAMHHSGVPRVLIANEVTAPGDIAWLAHRTRPDTASEVLCYVDSLDGVRLLDMGLTRHGATGPLDVLVELGLDGGRTGARSIDTALEVAHAAAATGSLRVVGASGFEGIIVAADGLSAEERVDRFLDRLVELAEGLVNAGLTDGLDELVVSAGGSVYFDRVVERLSGTRAPVPVRVVIRSGCYLSHDDGVIDDLSPLGIHPRVAGGPFEAALEVWAPVLSRPEPGRLIVGAGKRDLSTDGLFPLAKKWVRRGERQVRAVEHPTRAVKVDDQHAYLDVDPTCPIAVGDAVGLGISHPCTTFDKWRVMLVVDEDYDVVDLLTTRF